MKRYVDFILVAGTAFLVYVNNLGNGFTYDDVFIIEQNPLVQNLDWWGLVSSSYWGDIVDAGLYRPFTSFTFGANRLLGESAFSFHLVNNGLHAAASVLVLVAARALGASRFTALAAGLLFALHPIQTEVVNSVVGRAEILAFGFALGAFIVFARRGQLVWTGVLFFLASCSKESAAFALPLFALYWLLFERRNLAPVTITITVAVVAYAALRVAVLGSFGFEEREIGFLDNPLAGAPLVARISGALILLAEYAKRIVWPLTLSADYSYNQIPLVSDVRVFAGLALAACLGLLTWKKRGLVAFAALALLLPLTGFVHIFFPLGTLFAERLMYLPLFGAVLLAACGLGALPRGSWLLGVLLVLSAVRVVSRNPDWRDNETLFRRTVQTSPQSARSHFLLGAELLELERFQEAAASFGTGLSIAPQHLGARMSLGQALLGAEDAAGALTAFEDALRRAPPDEIEIAEVRELALQAALAAGRLKAREANWSEARIYFHRASEIDPDNPDATNSLGLVAERQGALDEAQRLYQASLESDPDYVPAILNLASVRMTAGHLPVAEELFRRAVSLAPDSYEAYKWPRDRARSPGPERRSRDGVSKSFRDRSEPRGRTGQPAGTQKDAMILGLLLAALLAQDPIPQDPIEKARALIENGRSLEALQTLEQASRARPDDAAIHHALGTLYVAGGRMQEALASLERAVSLDPEEPTYAFAYGELLYRSGRPEEALGPLEQASDLPEALILIAAVYEKLGPKEEMFSTLARYLELRPGDTGTRLVLGQQLEAAKRYHEALAVYRGESEDPVLLYHAANVLARDRETYSESETLVRKALEASPENLEAGLLLARVLERQERHREALDELERLRELHPRASRVHYNLARAYQRDGRAEDAQTAATLFQELSAKEQEASDREARVAVTYKKAADLLQHGKMLEAEPVFRSVLEIDPEHAQTRSMLAKIAFSKGDLASARRYIADAIERDDDVAEFHYLQALFSLRAGAPVDAVVSLQRSLELDPALPDAWSMLGSLLLDSGRAEEALECYLKAAALEPSEATVHLNLASAYAALGNDAEEEAAMERYHELTQR